MIAVDPVEMLVPPEVPSAKKAVYTAEQFQKLLLEAQPTYYLAGTAALRLFVMKLIAL